MSEISLCIWSVAIMLFGSYNIGNMIRKYENKEYFLFGLNFMCTLIPVIIISLEWAKYTLLV